MNFSGIKSTSLIDFPDKVATVLFTTGCNLRCPFCHNWKIVVNPKPPFINEEKVLQFLESRKKYINSVVVTGGEPTMHKELCDFLIQLKRRNFLVKLDTNGFFPQIMKECLRYVDYVALDVKTSIEKYKILGARDAINLEESIKILKEGEVNYELRTTLVPGFVDSDDLPKIGELIKGVNNYAFQQFIPEDTLDPKYREIKPYSIEIINNFVEYMKKFVKKIIIRV